MRLICIGCELHTDKSRNLIKNTKSEHTEKAHRRKKSLYTAT